MIAATLDLNTPAPCARRDCDRDATRVYNAAAEFGYDGNATIDLCDQDGHIFEWRIDKFKAR
jgi:transposase